MAQFSFLFKAVGLIEREGERERAVLVPSSPLSSLSPPLECRFNELKRQSASSSDYFVEREGDRKEGRKEGRKGVSVGWDGMGVAAAGGEPLMASKTHSDETS